MTSRSKPPVSRRTVLRLGAFTGLAPGLSSVLGLGQVNANDFQVGANDSSEPCSKPCNGPLPENGADALQRLIGGNNRWATFKQRHPGEGATRRRCLATCGQTPFAAIISCSDSRVPPELLFDQGLGDLFVARVAGNGATGTLLEGLYYGTGILGAKLLFMLGHSKCGAVAAAVTSYPSHDLEFVKLIFPAVEAAREIVEQAGGNPNDPDQVTPVATDQNVILGVQRLRKSLRESPFFGEMVAEGTLLIAGGVYDLATQRVKILIQ